ncbi:MAG TPA: MaoC/PaaZ C-terminal domain-containing protein [Candidatus Xenobia bacterium]|jgi:acyl dehydratase
MNPHALYFEDFSAGQTFESPARTLTESDIQSFAALTGDYNPLHTDEEFARQTPFGRRISHGLMGLSFAVGLISRLGIIDGTIQAFLGLEWQFKKPLFVGDTVHAKATVKEARRSKSQPDRGVVVLQVEVHNAAHETVQTGTWTFMMAARAVLAQS